MFRRPANLDVNGISVNPLACDADYLQRMVAQDLQQNGTAMQPASMIGTRPVGMGAEASFEPYVFRNLLDIWQHIC